VKLDRVFALVWLAPFVVVSSASCHNDFRFDPTPEKADSAPPPCAVDADCRVAIPHCLAITGACVECVSDMQCSTAGLTRCDATTHACAGCRVDAECAQGQICETSTGTCLFTCAEEDTCPLQAPACDEVRKVCVRCRHNNDCALDEPFCEGVSGRCLACLSDGDCPAATPRCDRPLGGCVSCITSSDCAAPAVCDPSTHGCQ
jgi:hypothetical protein